MKRGRVISEAEHELNASGYSTVLAKNMHTCADVFAERKGQKFIIKVVYNIDSITRQEAQNLYKLSKFLDAEPLVLASVSKNEKLKRNVNYDRFSIRCISPEMLPELDYGLFRLLASKSVGVKAKLDGSKLRNLRKVSGMRMDELASRSMLSKTTLYKHERGNDYASIRTISRLETVLNGSIKSEEVSENKKISIRASELAGTGMLSLNLDKAPFDIVAKKKNYYEISLDANIRTLVKRAALFKEIRETFEGNYPFFINERGGTIDGVPAIKKKDLMQAGSEDELLDLVC